MSKFKPTGRAREIAQARSLSRGKAGAASQITFPGKDLVLGHARLWGRLAKAVPAPGHEEGGEEMGRSPGGGPLVPMLKWRLL